MEHMSDTALPILISKTAEARLTSYPDKSIDQAFCLLAATAILHSYDLPADAIKACFVDGGGDGGIDFMLLELNGCPIYPGSYDLADNLFDSKKPVLTLHILQAKNKDSHEETVINQLLQTIPSLLNPNTTEHWFEQHFNEELYEYAITIKEVYAAILTKIPTFRVVFHYASQRATGHIDTKFGGLLDKLDACPGNTVYGGSGSHMVYGPTELVKMLSQSSIGSRKIVFAGQPIRTSEAALVGIVTIDQYFKFMTQSAGSLSDGLFEFNVRDYGGSIQVNRDIENTLNNPTQEEFWWLNNGVSILCDDFTGAIEFTLIEPRVVNGLQTSYEINKHCLSGNKASAEKTVLVKVIKSTDVDSRERIIAATNNQTPVSAASLRALNPVQQHIEQFLSNHGWWYDRQKNKYKNIGKPLNKIVKITGLAQAVLSSFLGQPDFARARPTTLIKRDDDYGRIFSTDYDLRLYLEALQNLERMSVAQRQVGQGLRKEIRSNVLFHACYLYSLLLTGSDSPKPDLFIARMAGPHDAVVVQGVLQRAAELLDTFSKKKGVTVDTAAKSKDFTAYLKGWAGQSLALNRLRSVLEKRCG